MSAKQKALFLPNLIRATLSYPREQNVCLWHAGRCGSTVLAQLISEDGRFNWKGEYLERRSMAVVDGDQDPERAWLRGIRALKNELFCGDERSFGIELKLWHAVRMKKDVASVYRTLRSLGFNHHIILERLNYLRIYLSGRVRVASGVTHTTTDENVFKDRIVVDTEVALKEVAICDQFYKRLKALLPPDRLYLCYEDHISKDPTVAYRLLLDFFQLPSNGKGTVRLRKTNARPARDLVANWSEVVSAFRQSPYAWMTDE